MKKIYFFWCLIPLNILVSAAHYESDDLYNYMIANYDQFGGKLKQAYGRYKDLLLGNCSPYAYKGYIHLLYDTGNLNHIQQIIPQLDPLFKDDPELQLIFAQVFEKTARYKEADERFIKLNDQFKMNQEIAFSAANSYMRRKEPENALKVIDTLLNNSPKKPNNFIFYFMKAQINIHLNNKKEALLNIQKCLEMHPRFDKGWLLFALLNEQLNQLKEAIKGYTSYLEVSGSNKEVEQHLLQLIFKQKMLEQHTNKELILNKQCFEKALVLFQKKEFKKALQQIDECLSEKPEDTESKLLKIQILSNMREFERAYAILEQWICKDTQNVLWFKTAHLLSQSLKNFEYNIKMLHAIEKKYPESLHVILYLADAYTRTHNQKHAAHYLKKAAHLSKNNEITAKVLYQLAVIQYEKKEYKELENTVATYNACKYEFAPMMNLMAYHFITNTGQLVEAEKLIDQVLQRYKNNPHFLDTKAALYLKQKKYNHALAILEKIVKKEPNDYTINIHLATAHYALGNRANAFVCLDKAWQYSDFNDKHECKTLATQWNHHLKKL